MKHNIRMTGRWEIWHQGKIYQGRNRITTVGFALMAKRLVGNDALGASHIAIGPDGAATSVSQTALQGAEIDRIAAEVSYLNNEAVLQGVLGPGLAGPVTIQEFGIFNAAVAGDMIARFTTQAFPLDPASQLRVLWALAFE